MIDKEQFEVFFLPLIIVLLIALVAVLFYYKKKGVNIEDPKFQVKAGLIFLSVPLSLFWFIKGFSLKGKIFVTTIAVAVGMLNYLFVDKVGWKLRKKLDIETKGDKIRSKRKGGERGRN